MQFPDCSPLLLFAKRYHRCCELQIINIQGIKKANTGPQSSYFSKFIASHFIEGLNEGNEGIILKCRTNVGILLKCRTTGRPVVYCKMTTTACERM